MLVERAAELALLADAFDRCGPAGGSVVLVSGEAGIGKTSLLRAFADGVGQRGRVLAGGCEDLLTPRALGPFRDLFGDAGLPIPTPPGRDGYLDALLSELRFTQRPTVVLIDDAHWADDASLDILRHVGRRVGALPALLVISYRTGEPDTDRLRPLLGALTGPATVRIELAGLSDATVARLARAAGADPDRLVAMAGGNPFFLSEALAAGTDVPPTVRDAVLARIRRLPAATRAAVEALAVIPGGIDLGSVERVTDGPVGVLAAAERAGLIEVRQDGVRYRHDLARLAVVESLAGSRRIALHRRVLAAADPDAEPSRLVHHAVAAADPAAVLRYAPAAAEEAAAAEAHHETVAFARLALEREDRLAAGAAARLHELAGWALYAGNAFGEAAVHAHAAVRRRETTPDAPVELARALLLSSRMQTLLGRSLTARVELGRALALLEPLTDRPELAEALAMQGCVETLEAEFAAGRDWCGRAIAAARRHGRADIEAHARNYLGIARVGLGDLGGLADLRTAIDLAGLVDHGDFRCRAAYNLAAVLIGLGRHSEAGAPLDTAEETARDHGYDYHLFHVLTQRANLDLFAGRWDRAERRLREQVATAADPGAVRALPLALLGRLLARRGDPTASGLIAEAGEFARRSGQAMRVAAAGCAAVEAAYLGGDLALMRSTAAAVLPVTVRANLPYPRGEVLRWLARAGEPVEAFDGCPAGFAAGLRGDRKSAAAAWAELGNPYEQALELAEAPDRATAFDGLRRLDELGATLPAALVRRRLRRRGVAGVPRGPQRSTRDNPGGLTDRQLAVLTLLAEGLTSAEIADRTVVSRRTVDNHVAALVDRLGVGSRREAVALAIERGWLPDLSSAGPRSE